MSEFPFSENGDLRTFSKDISPDELQWHWDEQDRVVIPQHKTNWKIQRDDELPSLLEEGVSMFITAGTWHRIIKGTGDLTLQVIKHEVKK